MSDHTPLPWQMRDSDHCPEEIVANVDGDFFVPVCVVHEGPQWHADAALIVRAVNNHDELLSALVNLVASAPAFRGKRIGGEGSIARMQQESHIAAEDKALTAIANAKRNQL